MPYHQSLTEKKQGEGNPPVQPHTRDRPRMCASWRHIEFQM